MIQNGLRVWDLPGIALTANRAQRARPLSLAGAPLINREPIMYPSFPSPIGLMLIVPRRVLCVVQLWGRVCPPSRYLFGEDCPRRSVTGSKKRGKGRELELDRANKSPDKPYEHAASVGSRIN